MLDVCRVMVRPLCEVCVFVYRMPYIMCTVAPSNTELYLAGTISIAPCSNNFTTITPRPFSKHYLTVHNLAKCDKSPSNRSSPAVAPIHLAAATAHTHVTIRPQLPTHNGTCNMVCAERPCTVVASGQEVYKLLCRQNMRAKETLRI